MHATVFTSELIISGFEAGGPHSPSNIDPWGIIGDESSLTALTESSSCFEHNILALRMDVLCGSEGGNACPAGGVGVYNPGFWGMVRKNFSGKFITSQMLFNLQYL